MSAETKTGAGRTAVLVRAASEGDQDAWDALVDEYANLIWAITRSYRLSAAEAADVSQTTWLRLCENITRLREPNSVGAWLATTARRECAAVLGRSKSVVLVQDVIGLEAQLDEVEPVDEALLKQEQAATVRDALEVLPVRTRRLISLLMQDEPPSYEELATMLGLPIGSIGPTRGRALQRLRGVLESRSQAEAPA